MTFEISVNTAPEALGELLYRMPMEAKARDSRNGPVFTIPGLAILQIKDPTARVIFDPMRDANPFFHVMEAVWMFAGSDNGNWPAKFAKNYIDYAEDDGSVHGAYGWRWRNQFGDDQILTAIEMLRQDPLNRRVVISMWDSDLDLNIHRRDLPCNTHIYLRADGGKLDMTVCNRSNDAIWGMLGANVVHMTMLQELISVATRIPLGTYRVVTNNLHVYPAMVKNFDKMWGQAPQDNPYQPDHWDKPYITPGTLLMSAEEPSGFLRECEEFINHPTRERWGYHFLNSVARPMYRCWEQQSIRAAKIEAPDWQLACKEWLARRHPVVQ